MGGPLEWCVPRTVACRGLLRAQSPMEVRQKPEIGSLLDQVTPPSTHASHQPQSPCSSLNAHYTPCQPLHPLPAAAARPDFPTVGGGPGGREAVFRSNRSANPEEAQGCMLQVQCGPPAGSQKSHPSGGHPQAPTGTHGHPGHPQAPTLPGTHRHLAGWAPAGTI